MIAVGRANGPKARWVEAVGEATMLPEEGVAKQRLGGHLDIVTITRHQLPWEFASAQAGMEFYQTGSPMHTVAFDAAGARRGELEDVLRKHLKECTDEDGRIRAQAEYAVLVAHKG